MPIPDRLQGLVYPGDVHGAVAERDVVGQGLLPGDPLGSHLTVPLASDESLTVFFVNGIFLVSVMVFFSIVGDGLSDASGVVDPSATGLEPVDSMPSFRTRGGAGEH